MKKLLVLPLFFFSLTEAFDQNILFLHIIQKITAIDLNTGDHVWQVPFGRGPTDHPMLEHLNLAPLGSVYDDVVAEGGILVTKTLLISFLAQKDEINSNAHGSILVALDKKTE